MSKINYNTNRNSKSKEFLGGNNYVNYSEIQTKKIRLMFPAEIRKYMNEWELNFIESLKNFTSEWSTKQVEIVNKIFNKYKNGKGLTKKSQKV